MCMRSSRTSAKLLSPIAKDMRSVGHCPGVHFCILDLPYGSARQVVIVGRAPSTSPLSRAPLSQPDPSTLWVVAVNTIWHGMADVAWVGFLHQLGGRLVKTVAVAVIRCNRGVDWCGILFAAQHDGFLWMLTCSCVVWLLSCDWVATQPVWLLPQYGDTPLHFASSGGHLAVVQHLIASGADVNAKSNVSFCVHASEHGGCAVS
eukprot:jgi/Mesvir1/17137/Mv26414-RA.1